jgi:hypothetical protein
MVPPGIESRFSLSGETGSKSIRWSLFGTYLIKKEKNALHPAFQCYNDIGFLERAGESPHLFGSHHQPPFC